MNATKRARATRTNLVLLLLLLFAVPRSARAQLVFTLDQSGFAAHPGDTLTFSGTLTNAGPEELFLNGDAFSLPSADLTLDDTPFLTGFPLSLTSGQSASGDLFTVSVSPGAAGGLFTGSFTILGGTTETDLDALATANFQIAVGAPEPASGSLLLAILAILGVGPAWRRRPRAMGA